MIAAVRINTILLILTLLSSEISTPAVSSSISASRSRLAIVACLALLNPSELSRFCLGAFFTLWTPTKLIGTDALLKAEDTALLKLCLLVATEIADSGLRFRSDITTGLVVLFFGFQQFA